jgi:hypothetical protein
MNHARKRRMSSGRKVEEKRKTVNRWRQEPEKQADFVLRGLHAMRIETAF